MGNDNQGIVAGFMHLLEHLNQVVEAPQVDSGFRLVKYGKRRVARHDGSNLDSFQLSAGEGGVNIAVDIVPCAKSHFREIIAYIGQFYLTARG